MAEKLLTLEELKKIAPNIAGVKVNPESSNSSSSAKQSYSGSAQFNDPNYGHIETDPNKAYGKLAQLLQASKPQYNQNNEDMLKKNSKISLWNDFFNTLAEGIALTAGQNSKSGAMPNVAPRTNNIVATNNDALQKYKAAYTNDQNQYQQMLLAQKLREIQYGIDANKYNSGVDMEKANKQSSYEMWQAEQKAREAQYGKQNDANEAELKLKADALAYDINKDALKAESERSGVEDPFTKFNGKNKPIVKFKDAPQEWAYFKYLMNKYPEIRERAGSIAKINNMGEPVLLQDLNASTLTQMRVLMQFANPKTTKDKLDDINKARYLTGDGELYGDDVYSGLTAKEDQVQNTVNTLNTTGTVITPQLLEFIKGNIPNQPSGYMPEIPTNQITQQNNDPYGNYKRVVK